jgi:hypothetical protein
MSCSCKGFCLCPVAHPKRCPTKIPRSAKGSDNLDILCIQIVVLATENRIPTVVNMCCAMESKHMPQLQLLYTCCALVVFVAFVFKVLENT